MFHRKHLALVTVSAICLLELGSVSGFGRTLWESRWEKWDATQLPEDMVVHAEAPPEEYAGAQTSVAALVTNPDSSGPNASTRVLALRDGSREDKEITAFVEKDGFSEKRVELSFAFYIATPHRNGSLLVSLKNREGQSLASFQLYAVDREEGSIQLNTFAAPADRRAPDDREIYFGKTWTPVSLRYDGTAMTWSLRIGEKKFSDLPVNAAIIDSDVAGFAIYSGFGSSSKTILLLDQIRFASLEN